jgi:hypothetical protein
MAAKITPIIAAPTTAGLVYVTGEFPAFAVESVEVVESSVTFKVDANLRTVPVRTLKTKRQTVRHDRTEHVTREFPAGEAVLTKKVTGAAVALALRMLEDGAKNVRLYTLDGKYNVPVNGNVTRRLKPTARKAA